MNKKSLFGKIVNNVVDAGITVASAGAGAVVGGYIVNHDLLNDPDLSLVAGVTAGATTYVVSRTALMEVKDTVTGKNKCQVQSNQIPQQKMNKATKAKAVK